MNIKEAIESVKMAYCAWESEQKDMYEVIELLQQGEKYKNIVEELEEFSESKALKLYVDENELWKFKLKKIIAEYFPKELPDEKTTKL